MDEHETLTHLLNIEKEAANIVAEAENDANKRISENERECRDSFERRYSEGYKALEDEFKAKTAALDAEYHEKLENFNNELKQQQLNRSAFYALVEQSLFAGGSAAGV